MSERIPKVTAHVRREVITTLNAIVDSTVKLLARDNVLLRTHCLKALGAVASTLMPKEEGALTATLPAILLTLKVPDLVPHALDAITPLSYVQTLPGGCFLS
jgi:U3 small nucleolar RNA-associated protein 10